MKTAIGILAVAFGLALSPAHAGGFGGPPGWRLPMPYTSPYPPHGMPVLPQPPRRIQPPPFAGVTPAPHRVPVRVPPPRQRPLPGWGYFPR